MVRGGDLVVVVAWWWSVVVSWWWSRGGGPRRWSVVVSWWWSRVSWWWSVVYIISYFAMNMIVFYIRDRGSFLFFVFVVLVWVLLSEVGDGWFWGGRGWG